ncbi:hypothetical protein ABIA35_005331 [Catenulispora sp. MAP12-49]|uniref:Fic family protein n=1 Tax=Catenulispora sp. MAP12-49 TaxID=3156302 RepID=UPI00351770A7
MSSDLSPGSLDWDEVDPSRHPFDSTTAEQVVRSLGPARRVPSRPGQPLSSRESADWRFRKAMPWSDAMSSALAWYYGRWALGWRWSIGEGDYDGGPVGNWCCTSHSLTTPEETITRVVAALCEWRGWLETLARWFEAYPLDPAAIDDQRILWDRTARNVILQVVDRTGCESGWYRHCYTVLIWFLTRWGVAQDAALDLVGEAIGGRFKSWTSPDSLLVDDIAEKLAAGVRPGEGPGDPGPLPDHLEHWLSIRTSAQWQETRADAVNVAVTEPAPDTPLRDGAAEDIRAFDGALDPDRAKGLLAALDLVRADAARGVRLDFELLRSWQQHVLGTAQPPPFREHPAFAKRGRERYGIGADTRARFDACLAECAAEAGAAAEPPHLRAARAYLDVCFFHPFDDGNARAAFLTLVFVLAREGVTLNGVGLLRRLSYAADDAQAPIDLARYIGYAVNRRAGR